MEDCTPVGVDSLKVEIGNGLYRGDVTVGWGLIVVLVPVGVDEEAVLGDKKGMGGVLVVDDGELVDETPTTCGVEVFVVVNVAGLRGVTA